MQQYNNKNKHLNYIKESLKIQLKSINEYKTNLYSGIILSAIFTFSISIFLITINIHFQDLINWTLNEYMFFLVFNALSIITFSSLSFGTNLKYVILNGELNTYLSKPISTLFQYTINSIQIFLILNAALYYIAFIYLIIFRIDTFSITTLTLTFLTGFLGGSAHVLTLRTIDSLAFYIKDSSQYTNIFFSFKSTFDRFPLSMFQGSNIYKIGLLIPNVYTGYIATQYYFNHISTTQLFIYLSIISSVILFCILSIFILWKLGLKNYEGYN